MKPKHDKYIKTFYIEPMGKPRMTQADKKIKRKCTTKYWQFKDEIQRQKGEWELSLSGTHIIFHIPMPKSFSKKKKRMLKNTFHQQKPDIDNILKAFLDSLFNNDSVVCDLRISKLWSDEGKICIINNTCDLKSNSIG